MKTFYIAGRTKNIDRITQIAKYLEKSGMVWSFDWTKRGLFPKPYHHNDPEINDFTQKCIHGIQESTLFVLLCQDSSGARGSFIELGIALTSSAEIWIIGDENPSLFSCLDRVHHASNIGTFMQNIKT